MLFKIQNEIIEAASKRDSFIKKAKFDYDTYVAYTLASNPKDTLVTKVSFKDIIELSKDAAANDYMTPIMKSIAEKEEWDFIPNHKFGPTIILKPKENGHIYFRFEEEEVNGVYQCLVGEEDEAGSGTATVIKFNSSQDKFLDTIISAAEEFINK